MTMMTITHKVTLDEANLTKHALEEYRALLLDRIEKAGGPGKLPALALVVGKLETLLSRDFSWTRPRGG